jgi:glutamine amidotransferase
MCRLFGLTGGSHRIRATFWLLDAPDSLAAQSHANPDGYGIASFEEDGTPDVDKRPAAAFSDEQFAREAREKESRVFVAHVRYASVGALKAENTHPFEMGGRVLCHNGHLAGLDRLEQHLGADMARVKGDTDSERVFALITREIEARGGDIRGGIVAAIGWIAANVPLYAVNLVIGTQSELFALRYPDTHPLLILERAGGGPSGARHLDAASAAGTVRVRSAGLAEHPSVLIATEAMDEDPAWRPLRSGELIRVGPDLQVTSMQAIDTPPAHQLTLNDLSESEAASQQPSAPA